MKQNREKIEKENTIGKTALAKAELQLTQLTKQVVALECKLTETNNSQSENLKKERNHLQSIIKEKESEVENLKSREAEARKYFEETVGYVEQLLAQERELRNKLMQTKSSLEESTQNTKSIIKSIRSISQTKISFLILDIDQINL